VTYAGCSPSTEITSTGDVAAAQATEQTDAARKHSSRYVFMVFSLDKRRQAQHAGVAAA
jgi:hypothetical protein